MYQSLIILIIMLVLLFVTSLFFIFKKEEIRPYYAFIPILNIHHYFKLCKIPFWTFFVPIINLIALICSPYNLSRHYRKPKSFCILALFFPIIFIPYIAFSKVKNNTVNNYFIRNQNDVDLLEQHLEEESFEQYSYNDDAIITSLDKRKSSSNNKNNNNISKTEAFLNSIDNTCNDDEILYDEDSSTEDNLEMSNNSTFQINGFNEDYQELEILDDITPSNDNLKNEKITISNLDSFENSIIANNKNDVLLNSSYKDNISTLPSTEAIAFGGEQQIENTYSSQAKNDELKCPRCGSSLVGAKGICPGCGMQI